VRYKVVTDDLLWHVGGGLAGLAASQLLAEESLAAAGLLPKPEFNGGLHHPAKVKRIIQLFMTGGVSQIDTYDYKPALERLHGQSLGPKEKPEGFTAMPGAMMKSPFAFQQYGQSGRWVSSVFPHQAQCVDDMAFLMAMASKTNVHGPGTYMMNTGFLLPGFPCLGAWISYGLGRLADNLPTFVVLPDAKGLPYTFVTWLAGAGIKAGVSCGQSDEWGYQAAEGKTYCYDLHATILHLLGIDHTRLTVRQNGIDRRLTDVHGHVIREVLA
jgi:hypothetical protein